MKVALPDVREAIWRKTPIADLSQTGGIDPDAAAFTNCKDV